MKSTIWKYRLAPGRNEMRLPQGAVPLTAQTQGDVPMLWVLVWPDREHEQRVFDVYGTGWPMPVIPGEYVGTFQMDGGELVWHLFDATRVAQGRTPR